ncbi:uncharacterized protein N0V89_010338 [Didymosphaeria variabile]|uniref:Uncharacterized protein n=1 Tax=Didymosphaeria variabile TaxID=1932322 RepID=A0A9W8XCK3_9PLEO|nr:uncharacterized protein N0V89_010338 [Didymosphaeria variabile]KAJ4346409.1 hypothetical protein N0V89_010338 [Didymosphaeria variabile]
MTPNTSWLFPPALNTTFVNAFNAEHELSDNSTEDKGVYLLLLAAVHNLTLQERVGSGFQDEGWGEKDAVVSVGDNTEANNIQYYTKKNGPFTSLYLVLPELGQYSSLPKEACGLCILALPNSENPSVFDDYSVPFPVLEQQAVQPKVFNTTNPTGVTVSRPSPQVSPSPPPEPSLGSLTQGDSRSNTNLIVGVVVGVLAAASVLMGLIIWLWTRRKNYKNPYRPSAAVTPVAPEHRDPAPRSVPLQQVPAVVRRPDSSASEVPPAYHEVVRAKETEP